MADLRAAAIEAARASLVADGVDLHGVPNQTIGLALDAADRVSLAGNPLAATLDELEARYRIDERPRRRGDAVPVHVFSLYDRRPTYHASGANERTHDGDGRHNGWTYRTRCGIPTAEYRWTPGPVRGVAVTDYEDHVHTIRLRRDHADLIGRPCARCYPPDATGG